jgi:signal peptidase I
MDVFWDNVKTILYALALALVLRFTIAQPFRIPSGSMQPTLAVGDYIVVTKWSYGYGRYSFAPLEGLLPHGRLFASQPQRGDVVALFEVVRDHEDRFSLLWDVDKVRGQHIAAEGALDGLGHSTIDGASREVDV